jgi:hypothetical protein
MDAKFTLEEYIQHRDAGMSKLNFTEGTKTEVVKPQTQQEDRQPPKLPRIGDGGLKESAKSLFSGRLTEWKLPKEGKDKNLAAEGEPLDAGFRDEGEYKKMLNFLRGRGDKASENPTPPKEAPKGWFVCERQSNGFWYNGGWTQDESLLSQAVFDSEKAAHELARVLGGIVIPAEEILG